MNIIVNKWRSSSIPANGEIGAIGGEKNVSAENLWNWSREHDAKSRNQNHERQHHQCHWKEKLKLWTETTSVLKNWGNRSTIIALIYKKLKTWIYHQREIMEEIEASLILSNGGIRAMNIKIINGAKMTKWSHEHRLKTGDTEIKTTNININLKKGEIGASSTVSKGEIEWIIKSWMCFE